MDAIKKKLVALREETDRAVAKANAAEDAANAANQRAEETEEKQRKYEDCLAKVKTRHLSHDIQVQTMGIFHGCPINDDNIGPLGINQTFCQSFS